MLLFLSLSTGALAAIASCPSNKYQLDLTIKESNYGDLIILDMLIDTKLINVQIVQRPTRANKRTARWLLSMQSSTQQIPEKVEEYNRTIAAIQEYGDSLEKAKSEDKTIKNTIKLSCLN